MKNNLGTLSMLFADNDQQNKYYQVWKKLLMEDMVN